MFKEGDTNFCWMIVLLVPCLYMWHQASQLSLLQLSKNVNMVTRMCIQCSAQWSTESYRVFPNCNALKRNRLDIYHATLHFLNILHPPTFQIISHPHFFIKPNYILLQNDVTINVIKLLSGAPELRKQMQMESGEKMLSI